MSMWSFAAGCLAILGFEVVALIVACCFVVNGMEEDEPEE